EACLPIIIIITMTTALKEKTHLMSPVPASPRLSITPLQRWPHFRCFSSLSPALLPASPCRLLGGLLRNILSSPLRASVR
uniref:Uncharacterized protein n=1 Tax=Nothobranchius furzeri TaxID=105023 RepID=A0A8C6K6V4_NOTFU